MGQPQFIKGIIMARNSKGKDDKTHLPAKEEPKTEPTPEVVEPKERVVTVRKAAGAECPASLAGIVYTLKGGQNYNPRVHHTIEAWEKLKTAMGSKGTATHKELADALSQHFTHAAENHHDFIGYMVRRHAIHIVK